jgi:exodeoxyribonuclease-1
MPQPTFFWHDYETFGADPRRDRPAQFAGVRTNWALEPIEDPVVLWCKPPRDTVPHPDATLITGITPQEAERLGTNEADFARGVHAALAEPGTCSAGFNSIRFDDEFTRNLLYRNFFDPYGREWENGNSRWDLIDLARMAYALRPDGIEWPRRADGAPSFRLPDLAAANAIAHESAHDALSDVHATLALGRLLRARQPRLFDWYLGLRDKRRAIGFLDWQQVTPVLHVSQRYPATRGCMAIVAPLAPVPGRTNDVVVFDLAADPSDLLALDVDGIRDRLYTPAADLPEGVTRIPLKVVHANRSPALAPLSVLAGVDVARIGLDVERANRHLVALRGAGTALQNKVREVYQREPMALAADVDLALYDGFVPDADKALLGAVRATPPEQLADLAGHFRDPRYVEMMFRYRARNWPDTLDATERERWRELRTRRLRGKDPAAGLDLGAFRQRLATLRAEPEGRPDRYSLLDALESWALELESDLP